MLAFRAIFVPAALCLALGSAVRGEEVPREESLPPARRVQGHVLGPEGWPLPGARVSARRIGMAEPSEAEIRPILVTSSDAEGRFTLEPLGPGSYQVDIEAPDHQAAHLGVHLPETPGSVVPVEVQLLAVTTKPPPTRPPPPPDSIAPAMLAAVAVSPLEAGRGTSAYSTTPPRPAAAAPSGPEPSAGASDPPAPEAATAQGLATEVARALEGGRLRQARALLDRLPGPGAAYADLFYAVGEALLRAGQTEDAVAALDGALARDPGHVEAHYRRALGLLGLGRHEDARAEFARVLQLCREGPLAERSRTALAEIDRPGQAAR